MDVIFKILGFQVQNVVRSNWLVIYAFGLIISTSLIIYFTSDGSKVIISLMTILFVLNPLISILFGSIYLYNSREFIELVLTLPIKRSYLFFGLFLGLVLPFSFVTVLGVGLPVVSSQLVDIQLLASMLATSFFVTTIFVSLSLMLTTLIVERSSGLGISFLIWLFLCTIYDGIVLFISFTFQDYPIEKILLGITIFNPIDLARISVLMRLDLAAMLGITGAVFQQFIGETSGKIITFLVYVLWIFVPLLIGYHSFVRKDF